MGFTWVKVSNNRRRPSYSDETFDRIIRTLSDLDIDIKKEKEELQRQIDELNDQWVQTEHQRDALEDWDSDEYLDLDEKCVEYSQMISELEACIENLEDIKHPF